MSAALSEGDTNEFPVVWREEAEGLRAEVVYDDAGSDYADPRDADNLSIMVCWHPSYVLGDEQIADGSGRGAVKNAHAHSGRFRSIKQLARWASLAEQAPVVMPLYLLDHSGISISAGSNAVGRGDTASGGWDEFGNPCGWDTTLCGIVYTTPERVRELCGDCLECKGAAESCERCDGTGLYCPKDWKGTARQWLADQLDTDVKLYDSYLRGEVYGYRVTDAEDEDELLDSCWGFLPDVSVPYSQELDYVKQEARDSLESAAQDKREAAEIERVERERCAYMDIATREA